MSDTQFDYIIIGGGTAGALLCNRLSASGRYRVLLVEALPRNGAGKVVKGNLRALFT